MDIFFGKKPQISVFFCNFEKNKNPKKCLLPDVLTTGGLDLGFFRALQKLQKNKCPFFGHACFITSYANNPIARPKTFFLHYKNIPPRERFSAKKRIFECIRRKTVLKKHASRVKKKSVRRI
jgi:hypothetical protein